LAELTELRRNVEARGLKLEAIENFDPAHWGDILLDGPKRAQHIENVKTIIRRLGQAGIPIMGYRTLASSAS
jgi:mannonate dehydratase